MCASQRIVNVSCLSFSFYSVPDKVPGLSVTPIEGQSNILQVQWDAVPCAEIYTVQYRAIYTDQCDNTIGPRQWFGDGEDTSVTLTELQAYTTYEIFVLSNNSLGYGESNATGMTYITGKIVISNTKINSFSLIFVRHSHKTGQNKFLVSLPSIILD